MARVTMNRPEKRNALNRELIVQLNEAFDRAANDEDARVVVLAGAGSAFSAGADLAALRRMQDATMKENLADSQLLASLFRRIYMHAKPVIASMDGPAVGGGCGLAAACDFAVASTDAKMGFPEVRIGFVPAIVMVFVMRKMGEAAARDLLLRGVLVSADEAAQRGLITRSVPPDRLDETVGALAREVAGKTSGQAVRLTKEMMAHLSGRGLDEALEYAARMNAVARGTEECRAGVAAFLEDRSPPWRQDR